MVYRNNSEQRFKSQTIKAISGKLTATEVSGDGPVLGWLVSLQWKTQQTEQKFSKIKHKIISLN